MILPGVFTTRIASVPQESILLSVERWIVMSICEVISRSAEVSANCTSTPATAEQQVRSIKSLRSQSTALTATVCITGNARRVGNLAMCTITCKHRGEMLQTSMNYHRQLGICTGSRSQGRLALAANRCSGIAECVWVFASPFNVDAAVESVSVYFSDLQYQ